MTAAIGFAGIVFGLFVSEWLRRRNRIEGYSANVFDRRIRLFEELMKKVNTAGEVAGKVIDGPDYSRDQRHEMLSEAILDLAELFDNNELYFSEEISLHTVVMLIGLEDAFDEQPEAKKKIKDKFYKDLRDAKKMVKRESGADSLNRLFKSITRANLKSEYIERFQQMRREQSENES